MSILILMVGFMAVAGALVYRINQKPGGEQYAVQSVELPSGAEIVSAVAQDGVITITFKQGDKAGIRLVDGETGELIRDISISN
mgnify:CR=1 FL=1